MKKQQLIPVITIHTTPQTRPKNARTGTGWKPTSQRGTFDPLAGVSPTASNRIWSAARMAQAQANPADQVQRYLSSFRFACLVGLVWIISPRRGRHLAEYSMMAQLILFFRKALFPRELRDKVDGYVKKGLKF